MPSINAISMGTGTWAGALLGLWAPAWGGCGE